MIKQTENDFITFFIYGHIIYGVYKKNAVIDLKAAKKIVHDRVTFQNYEPMYSLGNFDNFSQVTADARKYISDSGSEYLKAVAAISKHATARANLHMYRNLNQPDYPIEVFSNFAEAWHWLKRQEEEPINQALFNQ